MTKKEIIERMAKLQYHDNVEPIFELLIQNLHRVEFVKEAVGLRDLLFIAERGAKEFEDNPIYACFDVPIEPENEELNYLSLKKMMITPFEDILLTLRTFFINTDRTLYLWLAFKSSSLPQEDMFRVIENLRLKKEKSTFEAKAKLRKYPKWFDGKLPSEVIEEANYIKMLHQFEIEVHHYMKNVLLKKIDSAVVNDDKELFHRLSTEYNKLYIDQPTS